MGPSPRPVRREDATDALEDYTLVLFTTCEDFSRALKEDDYWCTSHWANELGFFFEMSDESLTTTPAEIPATIARDLEIDAPADCTLYYAYSPRPEMTRVFVVRRIPDIIFNHHIIAALEALGLKVLAWEDAELSDQLDAYMEEETPSSWNLRVEATGPAPGIHLHHLSVLGFNLQVQDWAGPLTADSEEDDAEETAYLEALARGHDLEHAHHHVSAPVAPPVATVSASTQTTVEVPEVAKTPEVKALPEVAAAGRQHTIDQCYRCMRWTTHRSNTCTSPPRCRLCAGPHLCKVCPDRAKRHCALCNGSHAASSKLCQMRPRHNQTVAASPRRPSPPTLSPALKSELRRIITSTVADALKRARHPG